MCVSHAKVPIVKIWDPELKVACDMNVNNTLALENTRMIRTYVDVDERVRPLAMIVKHWTKRRVLNDAGMLIFFILTSKVGCLLIFPALGGTLSSYTWICLIINFLQTREPPIVPSLQRRPHDDQRTADGAVSAFDANLDGLIGFGARNKSTLGELLFQFFRYYGHEIDWETSVISVREGKVISKKDKGWHLLQNNRLCVEEPFNTSRNLGNTADDYSFRGVHMELRRAFDFISQANLADSCEQFEFPPEEERTFERPAPQPRPTVTPVHPSRAGGTAGRGGRGGRSNSYRGSSRRASSAASRPNKTPPMIPAGVFQNHHAQFVQDQINYKIQLLQTQKMEIWNAIRSNSGYVFPNATVIPNPYFHLQVIPQSQQPQSQPQTQSQQSPSQQLHPQQQPETGASDDNGRTGTETVNGQPLTGNFRSPIVYTPSFLTVGIPTIPNTNPPSPLGSTAPEAHRTRRSSIINGSPGGSIRAQSQPARPLATHMMQSFTPVYHTDQPQFMETRVPSPKRNIESDAFNSASRIASNEDGQPSEYVGYCMKDPNGQGVVPVTPVAMMSPAINAPSSFPPVNGYSLVRVPTDYPPLPNDTPSLKREQQPQAPQSTQSAKAGSPPKPPHNGPLIVDGSLPANERRQAAQASLKFGPRDLGGLYSNVLRSNLDVMSGVTDTIPFEGSYLPYVASNYPDSIPAWEPRPENGTGQYQFDQLSERFQKADLLNDHTAKGSRGQPGYIPAYVSEGRPIPESQQATGSSQKRDDNSMPQKPSSTFSQKEDRPGSTNPKRRVNGHDNNTNQKSKSKPRHGTSHSVNLTSKERDEIPYKKSNGVVPNGTSGVAHDQPSATNSNGWQTTKKKNRKTKMSIDFGRSIVNGAEPLPADASLRKGG